MKIEKEIRPYKGEVLNSGRGTKFVCSDSVKDDSGKWVNQPYYTIIADGITCHIDEKNPKGIKIKVMHISGVTVSTFKDKTYTTIWADRAEVVQQNPTNDFAQIDEKIPF